MKSSGQFLSQSRSYILNDELVLIFTTWNNWTVFFSTENWSNFPYDFFHLDEITIWLHVAVPDFTGNCDNSTWIDQSAISTAKSTTRRIFRFVPHINLTRPQEFGTAILLLQWQKNKWSITNLFATTACFVFHQVHHEAMANDLDENTDIVKLKYYEANNNTST